MARRIMISRRDWLQDPKASLSGGFWSQPLVNILDARPQFVAEAVTNLDWAATTFTVDLGYTRKVGLIFFANLRTTSLGVMRLRAGTDPTFAATNFDTGMTTTWPPDGSAPFGPNAWGELGLTHVYMPDEYERLGYPRLFIPSAPIDCRYVLVEIHDSTASEPLQIGCFGACEVWQPPLNFQYGWSITPMDESAVQKVPFGSTYVTLAGIRRRLNLGFPELPEAEILARSFGLSLIKGMSQPLVVVPFPDDAYNREKIGLYGRVSNDSVLSNPFFGQYALPFQIDQLI